MKSAPTRQSNVEVMERGMLRYPFAVKLRPFFKKIEMAFNGLLHFIRLSRSESYIL